MSYKFFRILKECTKLDFFTMLKMYLSRTETGRVYFYKRSYLTLLKNSSIIAKKGFYFNKSWTLNDPFPSLLHLGENSKLIVKGKFMMYTGTRVYINEGATLILGSGFSNSNLNLSCFERIEIGENVIISENVTIRDSDNHSIKGKETEVTKPIKIGNNVWIGLNVTILKGVEIGHGAVVAAGSLVNKQIPSRCLCGGVPARIIQHDIDWIDNDCC